MIRLLLIAVMDLTHAIHTGSRRFWLVVVALAVFCLVGAGVVSSKRFLETFGIDDLYRFLD
jgi:hypothetical protein